MAAAAIWAFERHGVGHIERPDPSPSTRNTGHIVRALHVLDWVHHGTLRGGSLSQAELTDIMDLGVTASKVNKDIVSYQKLYVGRPPRFDDCSCWCLGIVSRLCSCSGPRVSINHNGTAGTRRGASHWSTCHGRPHGNFFFFFKNLEQEKVTRVLFNIRVSLVKRKLIKNLM